jgi:DeoR/GlpR family transcriptional regulator of sugar metabolism
MALLFEKGHASVEELVESLGVSRMTVHRDLEELNSRGLLTKVRGGATVARTEMFESSWQYRAREQLEWKRAIGRRALEFVEPGEAIAIDPSTTGHVFSQMLRDKAPLKVVTPSLAVVNELSRMDDIEIHVVGGVYDAHFNCFMGVNAENTAASFRVDKLFMSTAAISGHTICHSQPQAISLDRMLFSVAREHIMLVDSTKLSHSALHVFGDASEWEVIITDSRADPAALAELQAYAKDVIVVDLPDSPGVSSAALDQPGTDAASGG